MQHPFTLTLYAVNNGGTRNFSQSDKGHLQRAHYQLCTQYGKTSVCSPPKIRDQIKASAIFNIELEEFLAGATETKTSRLGRKK